MRLQPILYHRHTPSLVRYYMTELMWPFEILEAYMWASLRYAYDMLRPDLFVSSIKQLTRNLFPLVLEFEFRKLIDVCIKFIEGDIEPYFYMCAQAVPGEDVKELLADPLTRVFALYEPLMEERGRCEVIYHREHTQRASRVSC